MAAHGQGEGEVVEIGSLMGRSTCWLWLWGAKAPGVKRSRPWIISMGPKEHRAGKRHEVAVLAEEGTTFNRFLENLAAHQVKSWVRPVVKGSLEAARTWKKPIRLLFIDGDHRYEATRDDFEAWSGFVISGGYIAFHDVDSWPGVTEFYHQLMRNNSSMRKCWPSRPCG